MDKIIVFLVLLISIGYGDDLDKRYDFAIDAYNFERYEEAEIQLTNLINQGYKKDYIYFVLGKIYRKQEKHSKAVKFLKEYIKVSKSSENLMYAKINLAYEYLRVWNKQNIEKAKKIVDDLEGNEYSEHADFTYCYATVYNSSGFYILKFSQDGDNKNYYLDAVEDFKKALSKREELVGVANNLAVAYMRIIELIPPSNLKEKNKYKKLTDQLLSKEIYRKYRNQKNQFKETRNYFYSNICPICK